ncbi:uncharacterized protein [Euphorbia lathyris]|uniref:uncharacterized protein isoform X2 n=1 Tax=Euphorbia lathyris TaxID=212925 RepID=UPI0033133D62
MSKNWAVITFILMLLLSGFSSASASASPPLKIVSSVVSNVVSVLVKWLWSLKSNTKTGVSSRSMMKFESGYTVETVFDGNKLGIEPHSVEVSPNGELLVLDSENSNIYKISTPLSRYIRPKLIAGSSEGCSGHVDGKLREARMDHPKGLTMDDRGNIYIADTLNMAIRKINDGGFMTTIAGGKWGRREGHVDGPSEDAKFSNDFDVAYIGSSCSLLVIDRGNQAIREIQLHHDDCNYQSYDASFHLVLAAAAFFGYLLALLQRRVQSLFSSNHDSRTYIKNGTPIAPYHKAPRSVRPPLIPDEYEEPEKPEEGFFGSVGKLVTSTCSTVGQIFGVLFSGFRRKPIQCQFQREYQQQFKHSNTWPMQESFVIPDEDEPPCIDSRTCTPKKTYPFMSKEVENHHQFKQIQGYYNGWDGEYHPQQQQQMQMQMKRQQQQQHHHRHYTSNPRTYYQKSCETNEIVFGAVQEQDDRREAVVIKAVDYGHPSYNNHNIRPRFNYIGYSHEY